MSGLQSGVILGDGEKVKGGCVGSVDTQGLGRHVLCVSSMGTRKSLG